MRQSIVAAVLPLILSALALGGFRKGSDQSVPVFITALEDKDADVRKEAARALAMMGPNAKEAVPTLITALPDKDPDVRYEAIKMLQHDVRVRERAANALGQIGSAGEEQLKGQTP